MSRIDPIADEGGMTLIELLVATAAGVIVVFGISLAVIVTLRETDRVASHIDANQRARLTLGKVMDELHSACLASKIAPIQSDSTGTMLSFLHQTGSAVTPTPVLSRISLSGTTLSQSDYPVTGGAAPTWTFATTPSSTVQLMTGVSAISGSVPIFGYYDYEGGRISSTPLTATEIEADAAYIVKVNVAFKVAPLKTPISDANAATQVQDSALLRLTSATFDTTTSNLPCQ